MSRLLIEIKGADIAGGESIKTPYPPRDNHIAATVDQTATSSWADVTDISTLSEGATSLIVANLGTTPVGLAFSPDAAPTRYHVIMPGTQREVYPPSGKAYRQAKIKTL